jgi:hypothetical protein
VRGAIGSALGWVTALWGLYVAVSPLEQARVIRKLRTSKAVAMRFLWAVGIGCTLYSAHAAYEGDYYVAVPNAVGALSTGVTIVVARRYRPRADQALTRESHSVSE